MSNVQAVNRRLFLEILELGIENSTFCLVSLEPEARSGGARRANRAAHSLVLRSSTSMETRTITCPDGSRWKVIMASRSSPQRIELAFESLDASGPLLRGEAIAPSLAELTEKELCFLIDEVRRAQ